MKKTNPVSRTAYYCCGVRMLDAESNHPVLNDHYASRFMNEEGLKIFEAFRKFKEPNASNIARHRIIDDMLRDFIIKHDDPIIIIVGAGFDSRAYRLDGGTWIELEEPHVINYKNEKLPISECKNTLTRIPIRFGEESLEEKLQVYSSRKSVMVVVEGVLMYLYENTVDDLLDTLINVFPKHELACDLMTKKFFEKYSYKIHNEIRGIGATFTFIVDDPKSIFLNKGYQLEDKVSNILKAIDLGLLKIPLFILRWFMKPLVEGYAIYRFKKV
jgi:methyltransferase (TIGR00027 family)